jgi:uncharacterized damage-inducible protein DinB
MKQVQQLVEQLDQVVSGGAWHGPSLDEALEGVSAVTAFEHPLPEAHSIWEIVLHVTVWASILRRRLQGERIDTVPNEADWVAVEIADPASWEKSLESLKREHQRLQEAILEMDSEVLDRKVPGQGYNFRTMLQGAAHHAVYHAGQITILKRVSP